MIAADRSFPIRLLARSVAGGTGLRRCWVLICNAYTRTSGEQGGEYGSALTVACVLAPLESRDSWEIDCEAALAKAGVPYMAMDEWVSETGVFLKVSGAKRRRLFADLMKAKDRHEPIAFSRSLLLDDWEAVNEELTLEENFGGPYLTLWHGLMARVDNWMRINCDKQSPVLQVFVQPNVTGHSDLAALVRHSPEWANVSAGNYKRTGRDGSVRYVREFELAGMYAHALRLKTLDKSSNPPALTQLMNHDAPRRHTYLTRRIMREACRTHGALPRGLAL